MNLVSFTGLTRLPKRQRTKLAEQLPPSGANDSLPVSLTHQRIRDEHRTAGKAGQAKRITLAGLEHHLTQR